MTPDQISEQPHDPERPLRSVWGLLSDQPDEPAVKERMQLLRSGISLFPVPIAVLDSGASRGMWTSAAEWLFGFSPKEVSGTLISTRADVDSYHAQLLQTITDASTLISGARFGAASYHVADDGGGQCLCYSVSGTPRLAPCTLAIPRKANGVAPMFAGGVVVRSGDATNDRTYAKKRLYEGSSLKNLPVGSYLAVPMFGRSGKVVGGLFLGHLDPGLFTENARRVVVALVTNAAIAIDNVRLYEGERCARDAAETADRTKDEFLATLGHELRNPLSTVRHGIEAARLDPAHRERALELAQHGAAQLSRLTDDLLDVARVAHGKIVLRRDTVLLAPIVERAIDSSRQHIAERGHTVTVSLLDGNPWIDGDALRLEQVIGNLISNAAKYTNPGGRITVAVAHEHGEAVVRVGDTGMGIAPEMLPRVFDLFAQATESRDHAQGGLGIGLALVKRIVELHGGRVEAHSDGCGRGAEFAVRLPAVDPAGQAGTSTPVVTLNDHPRARVLLVEDNANAAETMTLLLEPFGHQVRSVGHGPAALRAALANPPDVMLVDIGLPGMDGYEVAQNVRQHAGLRHVNLVALTGHTRDDDRQRALAAGFDYHLTKPVNIDQLRGLVAQLAAAPKHPIVL